jgi:hypothetical protein
MVSEAAPCPTRRRAASSRRWSRRSSPSHPAPHGQRRGQWWHSDAHQLAVVVLVEALAGGLVDPALVERPLELADRVAGAFGVRVVAREQVELGPGVGDERGDVLPGERREPDLTADVLRRSSDSSPSIGSLFEKLLSA